jgi:hypothetical protein
MLWMKWLNASRVRLSGLECPGSAFFGAWMGRFMVKSIRLGGIGLEIDAGWKIGLRCANLFLASLGQPALSISASVMPEIKLMRISNDDECT